MNRHHYIIGLGSNCNAERNIGFAISQLKNIFKDIIFSTLQHTAPIGMKNDNMFINCVASTYSTMDMDAIKNCLKSLERECGRTPEDKQKGIIKLDLDIIMIDNIAIKKEDLEREYIKNALIEIEGMV